jgi:hypothetical protein
VAKRKYTRRKSEPEDVPAPLPDVETLPLPEYGDPAKSRAEVADWVAQHIHDENVTTKDAPGAVAWALLKQVRESDKSREHFWANYVSRAMRDDAYDEDEADAIENLEEAIDVCLREADAALRSSADVALRELEDEKRAK